MSNFTFGNPEPEELPVINQPSLVEKIKVLRRNIDSLILSARLFQNSPQTIVANQKLEEAKMWLGNTLKHLNCPSPYMGLETQRKFGNTREIGERAESGEKIALPQDIIESCDLLRDLIEDRVKDGKRLYSEFIHQNYDNNWGILCMEYSVQSLMLAKNWYGQELGRLRDERL